MIRKLMGLIGECISMKKLIMLMMIMIELLAKVTNPKIKFLKNKYKKN